VCRNRLTFSPIVILRLQAGAASGASAALNTVRLNFSWPFSFIVTPLLTREKDSELTK